MNTQRCPWCGDDPLYITYHDTEWGVPSHDDHHLFEMLLLEGAQAGLSWITILRKREGYRRAFHGFDPVRVAAMSDAELTALQQDAAIVRNRLKIASARRNARVFVAMQQAHGSFAAWLWAHVDGKPLVNRPESMAEVPASTPLSDAISRELKQAGMNFVGSTIIYAFLQATGVVNDHLRSCPAAQQKMRS
ncbi:DNA-3-methyladenine glycosylase I [Craterilacuibacter sinensis]|uniref:DNA-3-methyladenine glycosylase I n=1 Tax=Craterilacuibacter sinensis TaxID=2686017 RepID=A0A845BIY9_9NEIS|nr:DNA-3-methyladenine glycosylase I [Craterilacuibacter sinensis]MXR36159.1 DNA-3-methyladenine glycosylase I [Craterilacuibacter sinensis]